MRGFVVAEFPMTLPAEGCVDLWAIDLDLDDHSIDRLRTVLDAEETGRCKAFRTPLLQSRFAVSHGGVRHVLGRYLEMSADQVPIERDSLGKPIVRKSPLVFSISHSEGLAVCAVAVGGRLGVDIEAIRPMPDAVALARGNFSASEIAEFLAVPEDLRSQVFLTAWTRKEAFVKATGEGLGRPLDSFDVSIGETARMVRVPGDLAPGEWSMASFEPRAGFVGTLVIDAAIERVARYDWHPGVSTGPSRADRPR